MGIGGDRAEPAEKSRRGCLFKAGVIFIGLLLFGMIMKALVPKTTSDGAGQDPPFTFAPTTPAQRATALQHMRKEEDKVEEQTFYYHRSSPQALSTTGFYPYIGKQGNDVWLRMVVRYSASDWLFFNKLTINADGIIFELTPYKTERHIGSGYIAEWIDVPVHKKQAAILDFVRLSKNVTLRFNGRQFQQDKTITAKEKQVIADVFAAYQALGGKAPQ